MENMIGSEESAATARPASPGRSGSCSRLMLILALLLLAGTFFLISPPPGKSYPGAIPWRAGSILRVVTDWMSLEGVVASVRGVEIKDFAFHLATAAGLVLMGVCAFGRRAGRASVQLGRVGSAQLLLAGWVVLSLASSLWAGDADMARTQGLLYALSLAWAVSVAATLERREVAPLLCGLLVITAAGGALCVWYFHVRNPFHRPGFPIGNPLPLGAAMVPGILISAALFVESAVRWFRAGRLWVRWGAVAGAAALLLVPLIWCFTLAESRGAQVALGVGLAVAVLFHAGRWLRWGIVGVLVAALAVAGAWWLSTSRLDVAMARGDTIRTRLYAWRYATELWDASPRAQILGQGAAAYPRLAGALAIRDRAFDPAAFPAELVEHAHNELFEILSEIGLVGGVTYVGGFVATFLAAGAMRRRLAARERWVAAALSGCVAALLADALTGVDLRLPGVPAIFYTLLGTLWALCRGTPPEVRAATPTSRAPNVIFGLVGLAAGLGAGWLAVRNWSGVTFEEKAQAAYESGNYGAALGDIVVAERRLLDPVRVLVARQTALDCRYALAQKACRAFLTQTATAPSAVKWDQAVRLASEAYTEAGELSLTAPALLRTDKTAARAAEWLVEMYRRVDPARAVAWVRLAEQAWRRQRERTPTDVDTVLSLLGYSRSTQSRITLLRDALRALNTLPFEDESRWWAHRRWLDVLVHVAQEPGFEPLLARFVNAAGPITPETGLDAIIASLAPETFRLSAAWQALRGDYGTAVSQSVRAAELYRPLHARFPELESRALGEAAEYELGGSVDDADRAAELLVQATVALPVIQVQKYAALAAPYRRQLSFTLLTLGRTDEALDVLQQTLGEGGGAPAALEPALEKLLTAARAGGFAPELIERVRAELCPRFPDLCGP
jgi:O-antigen ligase